MSTGRATIVGLLMLLLSCHTLTAVYLDLRGPAHFHVHDEADEDDHGHPHAHDHGPIERHRHAVGDQSVVRVEDDAIDSRDAAEEIASGWSAAMCAALVSAATPFPAPRAASGVPAGPPQFLKTRVPGRLERPPQLPPV